MGWGTEGGANPSVVGGIGTGLQIAGIFGQASAARKKSSLERTAYEYQSKVAKTNEGIARMQAADAIIRGQDNENTVRQKTAQLKATQVAALAARNIDLGSGSPLEILTTTDFMGERDARTVRDNAAKEAWSHDVQAGAYADDAAMLDWRAKQQTPTADAFSTLLTGAGQVASSWYAMRNRTTGGTTQREPTMSYLYGTGRLGD